MRAGDEVGCSVVEELTLSAPLVLPPAGAVRVQVVVDAADDSGWRAVSVYSRGARPDSVWVLHAEGALSAGVAGAGRGLSVWPPAGARRSTAGDVYEQLAGAGL